MDVLHATGHRPDFPRHLHETFTLGCIESGAVVNRSGGRTSRLGPGTVYAFDPGDVHDGRSVDGALVDQSAFYPGEAALDALGSELGLRGPVRFRASRRAREYVDAHLADDVSVATLAALAGLSPGYFARSFRRATGLPPHAWLVQRRVERAKALINAGGSLADVALAVGFVDQRHLNLHFRRVTGVTAGRYARGRFLPRRGRG